MVQKVFREGASHLSGPAYAGEDISMMLRYSLSIYHLLFYLNADERRNGDCYWRVSYGVTSLPLIRSLIDCLYNLNPARRRLACVLAAVGGVPFRGVRGPSRRLMAAG